MKILRPSDPNYPLAISQLDRRSAPSAEVAATVAEVIAKVRAEGDEALVALASRFDRATLSTTSLLVSEAELDAARAQASPDVRRAVAAAHENVASFARHSLRTPWESTNAQGAIVGEIYHPFDRVGIYVPGGSAPLVSTAVMTCAIAQTATVPQIVAATPPRPDGSVNPDLLFALDACGATQILKAGGAQAIAALAYGTPSIAAVDKVFGPGNQFVVEAKRQVFGQVGVDLLPGPSEILVLADSSANPAWIAADLLAQAEHGGDSIAVLLTDSADLLDSVAAEIGRQAKLLSRQHQLLSALAQGCTLLLVESLEHALELANRFAPEHLSLVVRPVSEDSFLPRIRTAGAIFVGPYSPVAVGDFLAGPSHELPTGGAGKSFPGLTADQFQRRTSIVRLDHAALSRSVPLVETFARIEGLDAHGRSATIRLE
jgi:histidinol dehydrogenase